MEVCGGVAGGGSCERKEKADTGHMEGEMHFVKFDGFG